MSTIFFKINNTQEMEIQKMMKEEGYTSKAEFFRFLIKFYKYQKSPAEKEFENAAKGLAEIIKKLDRQGKIKSSLNEQLGSI